MTATLPTSDLLQKIRIAKPCTANWAEMTGDERARHCALCEKNVYNLAAMSEEEAERVIREKEGKLCARLYRRNDGTVIFGDCPKGVAEARRPRRRALALVAAFLGVANVAVVGTVLSQPNVREKVRSKYDSAVAELDESFHDFKVWLGIAEPRLPQIPPGRYILGDMQVRPDPPKKDPAQQ